VSGESSNGAASAGGGLVTPSAANATPDSNAESAGGTASSGGDLHDQGAASQ
jgi:hypothetical protein